MVPIDEPSSTDRRLLQISHRVQSPKVHVPHCAGTILEVRLTEFLLGAISGLNIDELQLVVWLDEYANATSEDWCNAHFGGRMFG